MSRFLLILLTGALLNAVTIKELNSYPKSTSKDFYIWLYFQQNISKKNAQKAFYQIYNVTPKLFHKYARKSGKKSVTDASYCMRLSASKLTSSHELVSCKAMALTPYKASKISKKERLKLAHKLNKKYPKEAKWLKIMGSKNIFKTLIKSDVESFLKIYMNSGTNFRLKELNHPIPNSFLRKLKRNRKFESFIKKTLTSRKLTRLEKSLSGVSSKNLNSESAFYLALNELNYNSKKAAENLLMHSKKRALYKEQKDRANYWLYIATSNKNFLKKVAKSSEATLYSLLARETLKKELHKITHSLPTKDESYVLNPSNPFHWRKVLIKVRKKNSQELKDYAKLFKHKNQLPMQAYIKERANPRSSNIFIMPYRKYLKDLRKEDRALVYALGRQESRFVPGSISTAYALGVMQIMPFLAKEIAKERGEKLYLTQMFKPERNLKYAKHHIKFLQKTLLHPLFIAYAYNGGIGFTKRMLKNGYFRKGEYEPMMSIELVPYHESRKYGKKVLANYVIYSRLLGVQARATELIKILTEPSRTDRFRK